jgi:hypothetical protein
LCAPPTARGAPCAQGHPLSSAGATRFTPSPAQCRLEGSAQPG